MYDDGARRGDFVRRDSGHFEVPEPQVDGGFVALRTVGLPACPAAKSTTGRAGSTRPKSATTVPSRAVRSRAAAEGVLARKVRRGRMAGKSATGCLPSVVACSQVADPWA